MNYKEFNVYFTDTEQSFCFIYLLWIAASQCHGTSLSERLKMFNRFQNQIFSWFILFLSVLSNKSISMCFDTLPDELNMQTSRLPRRLMDYITYGFFESNKNKANQKVHPTRKKKKYFNSSLWSKVLSALRRGPSCLLSLLAHCPQEVLAAISGSKVKADLFRDCGQVPLLEAFHFK